MIKRIIRKLINYMGYDITPINVKKEDSKIEIEPRKNNCERDAEGYNKVWNDNGFITHYNEQHLRLYNDIISFIIKKEIIENAYTVADIGCGPGKLIDMLSKKYPKKKYFGFDFSKTAIEAAQQNYKNINFQVHDIYKPIEEKYDFVICSETIEHLLYPKNAVNNLLNATTKTCLLTIPDGRIDNYQGHINFWSEESFNCFLQEYSDKWNIKVCKNEKYIFAILHNSRVQL